MNEPSATRHQAAGSGPLTAAPPAADNPFMTREFARVYERTGSRITGPIAFEALRRVGPVGPGVRVLDIAAGAGALGIPAAFSGATVLAIDIAPGMVDLLAERLAPFPDAKARVMNGEDLEIVDDSFDIACSIMGTSLFSDWRKGLREMARVLRDGGRGCVATWKTPPGGGPFMIMAQALREVFPDRKPPPPPEGFAALSDPARLDAEMMAAGFSHVETVEIEAIWKGPAGDAYLDELQALHGYMPPYAALDRDDRLRVDAAIRRIVEARAVDGGIRLASPVLIAVGRKSR